MESLEDFGLMAAEQYTQDKLLELGKDNYKKLVSGKAGYEKDKHSGA